MGQRKDNLDDNAVKHNVVREKRKIFIYSNLYSVACSYAAGDLRYKALFWPPTDYSFASTAKVNKIEDISSFSSL